MKEDYGITQNRYACLSYESGHTLLEENLVENLNSVYDCLDRATFTEATGVSYQTTTGNCYLFSCDNIVVESTSYTDSSITPAREWLNYKSKLFPSRISSFTLQPHYLTAFAFFSFNLIRSSGICVLGLLI
eukprot:Awhi_evm3s11653